MHSLVVRVVGQLHAKPGVDLGFIGWVGVYAALEMLAANKYVGRVCGVKSYCVTWDAEHVRG